MKKINLFVFCLISVLLLSACTAGKAQTTTAAETTTAEFEVNAPETGPYNASTLGTETLTIKGVVYRNRFQGDLILRDPQYGDTPVIDNSFGRFFRLEGTEYDLIYNVSSQIIGAPESVYCRDDQWQKLNAYYSNPKNFICQCIVERKNSERKTYTLDSMDIKMLNELVAFCEENSYDPFALGNTENTRSVSFSLLDEPNYGFGINSVDGMFSFGASRLYIADGKLSLEYYTVMSEEKTLIADVPDEVGQYFISLVEGIKA